MPVDEKTKDTDHIWLNLVEKLHDLQLYAFSIQKNCKLRAHKCHIPLFRALIFDVSLEFWARQIFVDILHMRKVYYFRVRILHVHDNLNVTRISYCNVDTLFAIFLCGEEQHRVFLQLHLNVSVKYDAWKIEENIGDEIIHKTAIVSKN